MSLYLVRHGEAFSEAVDPGRPLTEAGRVAVDGMGQMARSFEIPVSRIFHSGKARARQTAEILSHYLNPAAGMEEMSGMKPHDDVAPIARQLDPALNAMLVGHLPFMERLVSYLTTGSPDKTIVRFQP
jgi:phosphohistidine phosphatase